jgi:hypothetical protein
MNEYLKRQHMKIALSIPLDHSRMALRIILFYIIASITPMIGLTACSVIQSKNAMAGVYELDAGNQTITLEILPNETFKETILFASGRIEILEGKWDWRPGRIGFDRLWIPASFAPDYILRADSESRADFPKYTAPGYFSTSAEKHWGTITLEIFDDVSFKMIRHIP